MASVIRLIRKLPEQRFGLEKIRWVSNLQEMFWWGEASQM